MRENIKKVYFIHHDPAANDEKVELAEKQTRDYYERTLQSAKQLKKNVYEVDWAFACEGLEVTV